jgi:hypothetical protein
MKKILFLLFTWLLFSSCHKEEHKCAFCHEVLNEFQVVGPFCGYQLEIDMEIERYERLYGKKVKCTYTK